MVYSTIQENVKSNYRNITRVVKILEKFARNYNKRLNITKLAKYLKLNSHELDEIMSLILRFQDLFTTTFESYHIRKKIIDNQIFLLVEPKTQNNTIPKKIKLPLNEINLLNDIIYMFKFVKRGNGFDVKANGTELLSNIKEFWDYHPYFFEEHENGLIYPSEFGLKFGELLLSYKKSGKHLETVFIDDHEIMVSNNKQ
ncbi:MAG: hypothetical protein ACW98X_07405 [Promethearchaeota archaeon]|jgi:hypothetical protein